MGMCRGRLTDSVQREPLGFKHTFKPCNYGAVANKPCLFVEQCDIQFLKGLCQTTKVTVSDLNWPKFGTKTRNTLLKNFNT